MTRTLIALACLGCASAAPQLAVPERDCVDGEVVCPAGYEAACPMNYHELESDLGVSFALTCETHLGDRAWCERSYEGRDTSGGTTLPVCVRGDASLVLRGTLGGCTLAGEPDVCPAGYVTVCPGGEAPACFTVEGLGAVVACLTEQQFEQMEPARSSPHCVPG